VACACTLAQFYLFVPNFVAIGLFCRPLLAQNPNLCRFLDFAFSGVALFIGSGLRKLNTVYNYIINLPLSNGIKIVSVLQRLHGEIGRTLPDVQKRDKQTDKKLNIFGRPGDG